MRMRMPCASHSKLQITEKNKTKHNHATYYRQAAVNEEENPEKCKAVTAGAAGAAEAAPLFRPFFFFFFFFFFGAHYNKAQWAMHDRS